MKRRLISVAFGVGVTLVLGACSTSNLKIVVDAKVASSSTTQALTPTTETSPPTTESLPSVTEAPVSTVAEVSIEGFAFHAAVTEVGVGDTVVWTNKESGIGHITVADDGSWQSARLSPDDTFEQVFDTPGTYTYFCSIHPDMTGSIEVSG